MSDVRVRVIRSSRRHRTVSARLVDGTIEVRVPQRLVGTELETAVSRVVDRVTRARDEKRSEAEVDAALFARCRELSIRYLGGRACPSSVHYVTSMKSRWASASPDRGEIRVSTEVRAYPAWVKDYLLIHELAHFIVRGHGPSFWKLVGQYPRAERARGYLMAKADMRPSRA